MAELLVAAGVSAATAATISSVAAAAGAVATVASVGYGIYTAVDQSNTNAALAKSASKAAELEAQSREEAAHYDEMQFRRRASLVMGQQQAMYAAAGVDTSGGSPLFQELDTARQAEVEALNIRRGGAVGAAAARFQAATQQFRSGYYKSQIPGEIAGGTLRGVSLLSNWMKTK